MSCLKLLYHTRIFLVKFGTYTLREIKIKSTNNYQKIRRVCRFGEHIFK